MGDLATSIRVDDHRFDFLTGPYFGVGDCILKTNPAVLSGEQFAHHRLSVQTLWPGIDELAIDQVEGASSPRQLDQPDARFRSDKLVYCRRTMSMHSASGQCAARM